MVAEVVGHPIVRTESIVRPDYQGLNPLAGQMPAAPSIRAEPVSNVWPGLGRVAAWAAVVAVISACFEGPLRLGMNAVGLDKAIFIRDLLFVLVPIVAVVFKPIGRPIPLSVGAFCLFIGVHGVVSLLNLGTPVAALYGLKLALPVLGGLMLADKFLSPPGKWVTAILAVLWVVTCLGAAYEKLTPQVMPWIGVGVEIGGVDVALGRDWNAGLAARVAGLTRSSINLAVVLPLLSLMLFARATRGWTQLLIVGATLTCLVWSTQKGAIVAYALAILFWTLSSAKRPSPLKAGVVFVVLLSVIAPVLMVHMDIPRSQGVFSLESFIERIEYMWPEAWKWIAKYPWWMGVGLGGIGGAQRFYAPLDFNPADNVFVFLFANCGPLAVLYVGAVLMLAVTTRLRDIRQDGLALASLVFLFGYGVVISLIEDQVAGLWFGAVLGYLLRARQQAALDDATPRDIQVKRTSWN